MIIFHCCAKTLAGELKPDLKANLNEWTIITTAYNTQSTEYYKTDVSTIYHFPST